MATFKEGIDEYDESQKPKEKTYLKTEEIEKRKYKPEGLKEEIRPIQISATDTDSFKEVYFHTIKIGNFTTKVYCPKHNDQKECPACAKKEQILATQDTGDRNDPVIKEKNREIFIEAMKYNARKFFILRMVDMGSPKDGPKFYRIGEHAKKEGVWDKLMPVVKEYNKKNNGTEPTDTEKGCSFEMTCVEKVFNGNKYLEPSVIKTGEPTPIPANKIDEWVKDPVTWKEIFRPSTLPGYNVQQYIQAALDGTLPTWDKENKQWVDHNGKVLEMTKPEPSAETEHNNASTEVNVKVLGKKAAPIVVDITDDLPF